jgi:hypothetical protein
MGSLFRRITLLILLGVVGGLPGVAQTAPPTARIPRVSRPPSIEDFLQGRAREAEAELTGFRQYEPGDGTPVSRATTAYLSYDDKNLYVVFVCKDEPGKVRAHLAKREDIGNDEKVGILLDTFQDRHRAYVFAANPLGIQLDGIFTEGQGYDFSFDTLWYSEGRLTPDGYVVWMAIPFKSLRFSDAPVQKWGIAVHRVIIRTNETAYWPYITQRVQGLAQQFATLEGLEHISPGRNIQLIPYGLFARARFLDTSEPNHLRFRTQNDFRGGLDAKFVVKDALTFDVALNPDFSQVESDEPQVTINQRFEVFFPEKRPFFIENAGFFQTRIPLFFSRRIVDPQFGVRMTGKVSRWVLGALGMDDRKPGGATSEPAPRGRAGIGVVHAVREFSQQSKVGVFFSSRDAGPTYNRVISLETRIKLSENLVFEGQAMKSFARQNPDSPDCLKGGQRLAGPAYFAELLFLGRHLSYDARYSDRSPNFCSELGFVRRVDIRDSEYFVDYTWRPEHRRLVSFGPSVFVLVNWNRAGQLQDRIVNYKFGATFTGQTSLEVRRIEALELFQQFSFRKHMTKFSFSSEPLKWFTAYADYSQGTDVNFFPGTPPLPLAPPVPLPPFLADAANADAGFTLRPSPRVRFGETYIYSRLVTRDGSTPAGFASGTSIFSNHILRSKLNYQFNRELSLRAILDYNAVLSNPQLVALDRAKRLTVDLLFTYLLNPGTALYVGYTDRYENLSLDPGMPPGIPASANRTGSPTHSTGRQFFVKMSYLFRF